MIPPLPSFIKGLLAMTILGWCQAGFLSAQAADIYISPHGNDQADGSRQAPFATLERARQALRAALQKDRRRPQPVTIWLADGTYVRQTAWVLEAADSGVPGAPVTIRAMAGGTPVLRLGREIPAQNLTPVREPSRLERMPPAARGRVLELDLEKLGAEKVERLRDVYRGNGGLPDLFQSGRRLPLSRWPNGERGYETMKTVLFGGGKQDGKPAGGRFLYRGTRPARWPAAVSEGLWLAGFWRVPWICEAIRVEAIDPAQRTVTFAVPITLGIGSKYSKKTLPDGTRTGSGEENWFAVNLLEEIDQPGEWCMDFGRQKIYIWPQADPAREPLFLADIRQPVVVLRGAAHVRLMGLTLDGGADDGIDVEGGSDVWVAGCAIRNFARRGVVITDGWRHLVLSCDISETGLNAISLRGGDRLTLTSCGHQILNNEIQRAGCFEPTAAVILGQGGSMIGGGVGVNCVGVRFAHNRIHDVPNAGVYYAGNDNVLEFNEMFRIGQNSGDLGGFYSSGGWTSRGNVVRYNFVHHSPAANSFYLDDGDSGDLVLGNISYRTMRGALLGGGHDNTLRGNIFIESLRGGISVDDRGFSRNYSMDDRRLGGDFRSVNPGMPPWSERYPDLVRLLSIDPRIPSGVLLEGNVLVSGEINVPKKRGRVDPVRQVRNFIASEDPGFVDPARLDFRLRPDSAVFRALPGFQAVPIAKIGLYTDAFRTRLPQPSYEMLKGDQNTGTGFDSAVDIDASNRTKP